MTQTAGQTQTFSFAFLDQSLSYAARKLTGGEVTERYSKSVSPVLVHPCRSPSIGSKPAADVKSQLAGTYGLTNRSANLSVGILALYET